MLIIMACAIVVATAMVAGCTNVGDSTSKGGDSGSQYAPESPTYPGGPGTDAYPYPTPQPTVAPDAYSDVSNRKVIMTATIQIETGDLDQVVGRVRTLCSDAGGYVQSSYLDTYSNNRRTATVTIKVPSSAYESTITEIKKLGTVKSDRSTGTDVTGRYVDLEARLNNLKSTESRLVAIMDKANNVSDILAVEKELSRVRGDIESYQAQMNTLKNQIDFSTITVTVTEPQPVVAYDWGIGEAFSEGVHMFVAVIGVLIVLTGILIPLALYVVLIAAVLYLLYRLALYAYRRWGKKKMSVEEKK
ncbi:MAG: hypothetical protein A4E28_00939 [Methanocella sp. PtaU1.Bin125]|nr:MAG: hypothetical protein A4E28_00939 [Methanocella sp. PtaU1.Bin125]